LSATPRQQHAHHYGHAHRGHYERSPIQVSVSVSDSGGHSAGPIAYTITVYGPLSLPTPDPSSLPANGYTNVAYTGYINATGGSGNYSWSVTGLPSDGLNVTGGTRKHAHHRRYADNACVRRSPVTVTFNVTLTTPHQRPGHPKRVQRRYQLSDRSVSARNQPELAAIGNHHSELWRRDQRVGWRWAVCVVDQRTAVTSSGLSLGTV